MSQEFSVHITNTADHNQTTNTLKVTFNHVPFINEKVIIPANLWYRKEKVIVIKDVLYNPFNAVFYVDV